MATESSMLIGSAYLAEQTLTIDGIEHTIPAGHYYLCHDTPALSLITTLDGILEDAGIAGHEIVIQQDRKVSVRFNVGAEFVFAWPGDHVLRDLLGFTASIGMIAPQQPAANISPLLWSAGKPESPQESPLECLGRKVYDTKFGTAPDGSQVADSHQTQTVQTFTWTHVATSRFQTKDELGGEYTVFFDKVLRNAEKFFVWRRVLDDPSSTTALDFDDYDALGPYGYRPSRGAVTWDFQRSAGFTNVDRRNNVSLDCLITPEWGAM